MPWCRSWMVYWIIWRSIPLRSGLSRQWWVPGAALDEKYPGSRESLSMGNPACLIGILITHNGSWNNPYINLFVWGGSWMTGVRMIFFTCFFPSCFGRWVWMVFCGGTVLGISRAKAREMRNKKRLFMGISPPEPMQWPIPGWFMWDILTQQKGHYMMMWGRPWTLQEWENSHHY